MPTTALNTTRTSQYAATPTGTASSLTPNERLKPGESIQEDQHGAKHLAKDGYIRIYANRTQAQQAAARTGGEAFQDYLSQRFVVRFD